MSSRYTKKLLASAFSATAFTTIALLPIIMAQPVQAQTATQPSAASASSNEYILDKQHSKIGFAIGHMIVSSTDGMFGNFDGKLLFQSDSP